MSNLDQSRRPKIRIFNPHRLDAKELEQTFVARQSLFHSILKDIAAHSAEGASQHHLVVGQRGMGKTTLLRRISVELHKEPHRKNFVPLTFPEEQYVEVDRLSKFWMNCLDALADSLEHEGANGDVEYIDECVQRLEKLQTDEVTFHEECLEAFTQVWKKIKRRPVLLIDNFNLLLGRLRESDHALRGYFAERGAPILIAASTNTPKENQDYGAAFYDGFKRHVLHPLSLEEVRDVMLHLAKTIESPELVNRIHREMPRLAALRDLTGGNPRTAVLLFELFVDGFSEDAFEDLDALLDIVTPLYQSRLDQLSELAQTIVGVLARNWAPLTKAQIVEVGGFNSSSVSPQLGRLREIGLVEETPVYDEKKRQIRKQPGYQIAERFFNIWYLMRFTTRRQRTSVSCLARFLEEMHTPADRLRSARELLSRDSLSRGNISYAMALSDTLSDEPGLARELERRAHQQLIESMDGVRTRIAEILDPEEIEPQVFNFVELKQRLAAVVPPDSEITPDEFVAQVISSPSLVPDGPGRKTWLDRNAIAAASGSVHESSTGNDRFSASDITLLLEELDHESAELSEPFGEESEQWLRERLERGTVTSWRDSAEVSTLLELATSQNDVALVRRFAQASSLKNLSESAFANVTKWLAPSTEQEEATAWFNWGYNLHIDFARYTEAEAAYREVIRINPEDAYPWNNLGYLLMNHLSRYEDAEAAYQEAIRINPEDANPWNGLGYLLQNHLSRYEDAEAAYREAIRINPEYATPWNNLGNLLQDYLNRYGEAEDTYREAILLDASDDWPRLNLAFLMRDIRGDSQQAREILQELVDLETGKDTQLLHEVLFATYDDNWGEAANFMRQALQLIGGNLPPNTRDDWFRASAVLLHLGFGDRLIRLLEEEGASVKLLPWFSAVKAHAVGDRQWLVNIPLEARSAAEKIFDEIEKRRSILPPR